MAKSLYRMENRELAVLLRELRERGGMVQTTLAERLGRNQTFVSNVELGIRRLDLVELRDYCVALKVELRGLIEEWEGRISVSKKAVKKAKR